MPSQAEFGWSPPTLQISPTKAEVAAHISELTMLIRIETQLPWTVNF